MKQYIIGLMILCGNWYQISCASDEVGAINGSNMSAVEMRLQHTLFAYHQQRVGVTWQLGDQESVWDDVKEEAKANCMCITRGAFITFISASLVSYLCWAIGKNYQSE